jgi:hypothetical protein
MRVTLAMRQNIAKIPVIYVNLTEEEEREALATFDSVGAMAGCDDRMLSELLNEVTNLDLSFGPFASQILEVEGVKEDFSDKPKIEKPRKPVECPVCGNVIQKK